MIVLSQAFLLSTEQATPLANPRILWNPYTRGALETDITASTSADGYPKDAPLRADTWETWKPTALPATWVQELGSTKSIDAVGIAGHTFGTCGVSVKIETQLGSEDYETLAEEVAPADNAPLLFLDDARNCNRYRITLTGSGAMPVMGVVYAGVALAMQRQIYSGHTPITLSRQTTLSAAMSRGGQFLGQDVRSQGVQGSFAFKHLSASWYRTNFDPFVKAARQYPAFFAWRPSTWPLEVAYGWVPKDIAPSNMGIRDFMQVSFSVVGLGYE